MLSDKLAWMLEKQADRLTRSWVNMLKSNPNTASYHKIEDESLIQRIHEVYQKLSLWLDWEVSSRDLARFFMMIGQERHRDELPLSEVIYAVVLARRNLYEHIKEESVLKDSLDLQRLIEFNSRVTYFFDKAAFFVIKGYEGFSERVEEEEGLLDRVLHAFTTGTAPRGSEPDPPTGG